MKLFVILMIGCGLLASGQIVAPVCMPVSGVLFTNVGAISGDAVNIPTNLGVVYGDLRGAVAATIMGPGPEANSYRVQHYWVLDSGEKITFKEAILKAIPTGDNKTVAVTYDNYQPVINGGTGKYEGASGKLSCMGAVDFAQNHLVLRYTGEICYPRK